ncbi:MAG TPA: glycosyltransferase family 4 protein [Thermoanaerobaculia bacterium]|nr:glycosyltransferase family 4 protein [Thermoanaerobaculia bacterium]
MRRLAIVASHVIQYQDPFYRRLAARPELDVTVFFCSREGAEPYRDVDMGTTLQWDIEMLRGYEHRFLRNFGWGHGFFRLVNPGLIPALRHFDAVLFMTGWAWCSAWIGFAACLLSGTPFFLYGDSSFVPAEDSLRGRVRTRVMRALFRRTHRFMISGALNAEYYKHYGADERRFFPLPWAIDNDRFVEGSRFAEGEREAMRARYGIAPGELAVIYSGKLIERKDPMTLLRALARRSGGLQPAGFRPAEAGRYVAVFLGEGILREPLERFAREHGVRAAFAGFVNQTELPKHYAMGDVFVLPSHFDPRATVVNEAMACGLPVVITDRCGPSADLVRHGENGFVFTPGDDAKLAESLDALADPALRSRMSNRSREIIAGWSYAEGVEGVLQAMQS